MKADLFKAWLEANYKPNSVSTHFYQVGKIEKAYGDLDTIFDEGRVDELSAELDYSTSDAREGKPNPSKLDGGNNLYANLAALKSSLRCYEKFRETTANQFAGVASPLVLENDERAEGKSFRFEKNLQETLRAEIEQLEAGLEIIDGGQERGVRSGFIDILARDINGSVVVIELKADKAKREAVGQIAGYMGDMVQEDPGVRVRGILVAAEFDKSCRSAVRVVPDLKLMKYRFNFDFSEAE